ncbi:MAG TPA: hypothetical protein VNK92_00020, partial [Vicinamibacterales bacterium]|nr:hypothetical protein [Vicinamibacterales bacterium]
RPCGRISAEGTHQSPVSPATVGVAGRVASAGAGSCDGCCDGCRCCDCWADRLGSGEVGGTVGFAEVGGAVDCPAVVTEPRSETAAAQALRAWNGIATARKVVAGRTMLSAARRTGKIMTRSPSVAVGNSTISSPW